MYGSGKNDTAVQLPKGFDQAGVNARLQHYLSPVLPMIRSPCHARKGAIAHTTRQLWVKPTSAALCSRHPPTVSSPLLLLSSLFFPSGEETNTNKATSPETPPIKTHTQQCTYATLFPVACKTTETSMYHVRWGKSSVPLTDVHRRRGDSIQSTVYLQSRKHIIHKKAKKSNRGTLCFSFLSPVGRVKKKKHKDMFENVQPLFN